jgi:hypothetical protein
VGWGVISPVPFFIGFIMSSDYLTLTNRVLRAFNEVNLTSSNFASATGFHAEVKDAINQAIIDIYTFEDTEWPFAWDNTTFDTTVGQTTYAKDTDFISVDWQSFKIKRGYADCFTLTQTGGTATFTSVAAHNFITGDRITISGANETDYNGTFTVTVTGSTLFTFDVSSSAAASATGTIIAKSDTVTQRTLRFKDINSYRDEKYDDDDAGRNSTGYAKPIYAVRKSDNNVILTPAPDRVYTIYYEGFVAPTALSAYNDTSAVPTMFDQVIVDKALHYCYMFRDNLEQATLAHTRYEDNVRKMRRILIPVDEYFRYTD